MHAEEGLPVAIVERKIFGERVASPVHESEQDHLAGQLADFLTALHAFPGSEAAAIGVPRSPVAVEARHHLEMASPFLSDRVRRWVDREISDLEGTVPPSTVVHRDIRAEHLYVDAAGDLVGVIDFGDSTIDDPALDFAKITGDFGDHFLHQTLRQYGGSPTEGILVRVQTYRHLETLWEVAEDAWGDRAKAIRRLSALADATGSGSQRSD